MYNNYFLWLQAEQSDSGLYTLVVRSEEFPDSLLSINFTINIVDKIPGGGTGSTNLAVIISCSVVGVLIVLIVVGFFVRKKFYKKGKFFIFPLYS